MAPCARMPARRQALVHDAARTCVPHSVAQGAAKTLNPVLRDWFLAGHHGVLTAWCGRHSVTLLGKQATVNVSASTLCRPAQGKRPCNH